MPATSWNRNRSDLASENLLAHEIFAYAFLQYARATMTPKDASDPSIGPGTLWDVQKNRTVRTGLPEVCVNLQESEVPEMPVFEPGDIYKHPAIQNYIRPTAAGRQVLCAGTERKHRPEGQTVYSGQLRV